MDPSPPVHTLMLLSSDLLIRLSVCQYNYTRLSEIGVQNTNSSRIFKNTELSKFQQFNSIASECFYVLFEPCGEVASSLYDVGFITVGAG